MGYLAHQGPVRLAGRLALASVRDDDLAPPPRRDGVKLAGQRERRTAVTPEPGPLSEFDHCRWRQRAKVRKRTVGLGVRVE
jgi:hypothetical protein